MGDTQNLRPWVTILDSQLPKPPAWVIEMSKESKPYQYNGWATGYYFNGGEGKYYYFGEPDCRTCGPNHIAGHRGQIHHRSSQTCGLRRWITCSGCGGDGYRNSTREALNKIWGFVHHDLVRPIDKRTFEIYKYGPNGKQRRRLLTER